jgi:RNA polymerase sigma-B factor
MPNAWKEGTEMRVESHFHGVCGAAASVERLFARLQDGDSSAREALIEMHLGFAYGLAHRYAGRGEDTDDLRQVASYALVKAVDRFDPERASSFRAYASPTILGELKRHFRDRTWAVRVPRSLNERALEVARAERELSGRTGAVPGTNELADYLGWSLEQVLEAVEAFSAHSALSLDRRIDSGDGEQQSLIETLGEIDCGFEFIDDYTPIAQAVSSLSERDQRVLHLRFTHDMTQSEIAAQIGVSQMQVSRILSRALAALRSQVEDPAGTPGRQHSVEA